MIHGKSHLQVSDSSNSGCRSSSNSSCSSSSSNDNMSLFRADMGVRYSYVYAKDYSRKKWAGIHSYKRIIVGGVTPLKTHSEWCMTTKSNMRVGGFSVDMPKL